MVAPFHSWRPGRWKIFMLKKTIGFGVGELPIPRKTWNAAVSPGWWCLTTLIFGLLNCGWASEITSWFLWFIPTGNPSIYILFSYSYQELATGAGFRWPIHSMLIADNNTTFGWSPNSAPEFSTSIGLGPKKPMALHDGHRLQQKSRRKSDLKWWPPNQWEFQDPIHWRYLPYIRPIF